jgi:hypothetical protein
MSLIDGRLTSLSSFARANFHTGASGVVESVMTMRGIPSGTGTVYGGYSSVIAYDVSQMSHGWWFNNGQAYRITNGGVFPTATPIPLSYNHRYKITMSGGVASWSYSVDDGATYIDIPGTLGVGGGQYRGYVLINARAESVQMIGLT